MRKNLFELLAQRDFDITEEYRTLWYLFAEEHSVAIYTYLHPLPEYINKYYFRELPFRGSFTNVEEIMKGIGLEKYSLVDMDKLLLFCEFLIAILPEKIAPKDSYFSKQRNAILGNIRHILDQTNHEIILDSDNNQIIVEKNKSATLAAEIVEDTAVSIDLITYNHYALKGNLAEKKKILTAIGSYIEPILKSRALDKAGYKQLESDTGFVLNCFHIRHNNKTGAKEQEYIKTLSDTELEKWYDRAYDMMIAVILINEHIPVQEEIKELKGKYTWRM